MQQVACNMLHATKFHAISHALATANLLHVWSNIIIMAKFRKEKVVAACIIIVAILMKRKKQRQKKRNRKVWVRNWIKNRDQFGAYHQLMQELTLDVSSYRSFVRINASQFEELIMKVAPLIARKDTVMRQAIPVGERLALTLRFIATGMCINRNIIVVYIFCYSNR